jgi:hypothetical protein
VHALRIERGDQFVGFFVAVLMPYQSAYRHGCVSWSVCEAHFIIAEAVHMLG